MNYLTRKGGKNIDDQLPLQVDDVTQASDRVAAPTETVTFACGAKASSTGINALDRSPILNLTGDKVGSFWGNAKNLVYTQGNSDAIGTLIETATAAEVIVTDRDNNLELFFEIASGNRTHVLRAIDDAGNVLYGWIGGVAASTGVYTIDVHNAVTSGAQSWVGSLANFDGTAVRIEIYRYESSFSWVTGTVLTEEVAFDEEMFEGRQKEFFDNLSAGQYALNYRTGAIAFKKATTGTSDTCDYNTMASASVTVSPSGTSAAILARTTGLESPAVTDDALVIYDVSGGGAMPTSKYRASTNGNGDATVVYTSANSVTVSGAPFTLQNEDLVYLREVDATGNTAHLYENGKGGIHMEIASNVVTISGNTALSANGVYELGFNGQDKAYTAASNSNRSGETDPLSAHHVEETLATVSNETSATNYYYVDMDGFRFFSIDGDTSGTTPTDTLTVTIEAGNQDDGTAPASIFYTDVTQSWFGVASVVDADFRWEKDTPTGAKYVRVKTVTAGGSNDADYALYLKKFY